MGEKAGGSSKQDGVEGEGREKWWGDRGGGGGFDPTSHFFHMSGQAELLAPVGPERVECEGSVLSTNGEYTALFSFRPTRAVSATSLGAVCVTWSRHSEEGAASLPSEMTSPLPEQDVRLADFEIQRVLPTVHQDTHTPPLHHPTHHTPQLNQEHHHHTLQNTPQTTPPRTSPHTTHHTPHHSSY